MSETGSVTSRPFGTLEDGREILLYTLQNAKGMAVSLITYGARLVAIAAPDRTGAFGDILLGYDDLPAYVNDPCQFGPIIGRYANRIGRGKFSLDGVPFQVTVNDGANHIHGGTTGFHKAVWEPRITADSGNPSVCLEHRSPDGEGGYPGAVHIRVTYALTASNELTIEYRGTTDRPTILNLTSHGYFNLTGDPANSILDHSLKIASDFITPVDEALIPTGALMDVGGTPFDFRASTRIGDRIDDASQQITFGRGYDHNWVLRGQSGSVRKAAEVFEPSSGRVLEVITDQPGLQVYSGNFLDGTVVGKRGIAYQRRSGVCLEAQNFPDAPNKPHFPPATLRPGEVYKQVTTYRFSAR